MRSNRSRTQLPGWLAIAVLLLLVRLASGAGDQFETANKLYDQGKFSEARLQYEKLVDAREWSANLFFNLGNTDFRLGASGSAILNYERALALEPGHPEARANLVRLRNQTGARLRAGAWWEKLLVSRYADAWAIIGALAVWAMIISLAVIATSKRRGNGGLWLTVAGGVLLAAYSAATLWQIDQERAAGIVVAKQSEARLAPAESAGLAETLPAGSRVRVLSERGAWTYCALPGEGRGWIPSNAIERIRPSNS